MPLRDRRSRPQPLLLETVQPEFRCPEGTAAVPGGKLLYRDAGPMVNSRTGEELIRPAQIVRVEPF